MADLITCPGCEGYGSIREGRSGTVRCEVCKGEGEVEMRLEDAPPVIFGVLLAVAAFAITWFVLVLADVLEGAP